MLTGLVSWVNAPFWLCCLSGAVVGRPVPIPGCLDEDRVSALFGQDGLAVVVWMTSL